MCSRMLLPCPVPGHRPSRRIRPTSWSQLPRHRRGNRRYTRNPNPPAPDPTPARRIGCQRSASAACANATTESPWSTAST
ncbi:hypothetical protein TVNIR_1875 [Thioalkalivibrio nitratireducens DSM 14787]|uniref:Uncharacterized protein n=1 Tax=Thioalkalivibrio nitratireducens (strain DSM 14787 / UNIQEM 213 / ALEN2) TaxID=1255043 RepID=L0DYV1_THIND|nr:hypothetical protein TVNIR_1875 [Thioalkalivibrio nitratireducens DSM 14787]